MPPFMNLTGERFGRLIVVERAPRVLSGKQWKTKWVCRCNCGSETVVSAGELRTGDTKSCGCLQRERAVEARTIHGDSPRNYDKEPEYVTWRNMIGRCEDQNRPGYRYYGGRGIRVCGRWRYGENGLHPYICFLIDMGRRPSSEYSIDRYPNNDGDYEPRNCRWATHSQQMKNRRKPHHNTMEHISR